MGWEYRILWVASNINEATLDFNSVGEDGWELVAVDDRRAFFKRQLPVIER